MNRLEMPSINSIPISNETTYILNHLVTGVNDFIGVRLRGAPPYLVKYIESHRCCGT